jgi:PRC-barrel domain protein
MRMSLFASRETALPVVAGKCIAFLFIAIALCTFNAQGQSNTPSVAANPGAHLIGATVVSQDGQLVGAIDDVIADGAAQPQTIIVGLGGFLGVGEKDVAVPYGGIHVRENPKQASMSFPADGKYAGSNPARVTVDMSLQQLIAAPAYKSAGPGAPSSNSGTPSNVHEKEPPSSTESGGPG